MWWAIAVSLGLASGAFSATRVSREAVGVAQRTAGRARTRHEALIEEARRWIGVPYQFGGGGRTGIDCSAYVRELYLRIFGVVLPRTTRSQITLGIPVELDPVHPGGNLLPGDLVFYVNASGRPHHVVVYLGDGRFSHSASGRGVLIEGFDALRGRQVVVKRVVAP